MALFVLFQKLDTVGVDDDILARRGEGDDEREAEANNLSDDQLLCETKLDDGATAKVYETTQAYLCPNMAPEKQKGGTRIGKSILQKEIPREQALKLFLEGKTDVIAGFISKKGRPFSAHLLLDKTTGKLGWEFPPRPKKPANKAKAKSNQGTEPTAD